jgi:hypothetical protein
VETSSVVMNGSVVEGGEKDVGGRREGSHQNRKKGGTNLYMAEEREGRS